MVDFDAAVAACRIRTQIPCFWRKSLTKIRNSARMWLPIRVRIRV